MAGQIGAHHGACALPPLAYVAASATIARTAHPHTPGGSRQLAAIGWEHVRVLHSATTQRDRRGHEKRNSTTWLAASVGAGVSEHPLGVSTPLCEQATWQITTVLGVFHCLFPIVLVRDRWKFHGGDNSRHPASPSEFPSTAREIFFEKIFFAGYGHVTNERS